MALEPGGRVGHFEILGRLGAGGMGDVYRARDTRLGRHVALKVLPAALARDPEFRARFDREARLLASLSHPGIATIHGVETTAEAPVLVLELVEGETLAERMRGGPVALAEALDIARQIADALAFAHQQHIIHRDLKPANVMVDRTGRVKLLDFGVARVLTSTLTTGAGAGAREEVTRPGELLGTMPYMAPEQFEGAPTDQRADVFALGVVLYELVTGGRPFGGDSAAALMHAILHQEMPPLAAPTGAVPHELAALVRDCLEKHPSRRIQRAADVRDRIDAIRRALEAGSGPVAVAAPAPAKSVAVLPFANMSADREQEYFCDGMAEEIINALAQVEGLRVVARTSAFAFKGRNEDVREIGRKLGVASVVEGSARLAGDRLRVTAQLIDVETGYHLWSERFDRTLDDVFELQDEIALAIVDRLKVTLLHGERARLTRRHTNDREAYELYLKGRYTLNRRHRGDPERAAEYFRAAIARDPDYVLPHLGIAEIFFYLGIWSTAPPHEVFPQARAAAARALALDDAFGDSHAIMSCLELLCERDWHAAESHVNRALALSVTSPLGYAWCGIVLNALGRSEEAIHVVAQAVERDPMSPIAFMLRGGALTLAGCFDDATASLRRALELDPELLAGNMWMGWCFTLKGDHEAAIPFLQKGADGGLTLALGLLAMAQGLAGRRVEAEASAARLEALSQNVYVSEIARAVALVGLGRLDESMDRIERSVAAREPAIAFANTAIFAPLRSHPRFAELARHAGVGEKGGRT